MESSKIQIWRSGYSIQGESGKAELLGEYEATSFDEAVAVYMKENPGKIDIHKTKHGNIYTDWGCTLYDNEKQARLAFG